MPIHIYVFSFFLLLSLPVYTFSTDSTTLSDAGEATIELEITASPSDTSEQLPKSSTDTLYEPDTMPELINFVNALYPKECIRKGIEGTVLLELLVNDSGTVDSVTILKGCDTRLDTNAASAARHFRFSPAQANGLPVAVYLQYAYTFSLNDAVDSLPMHINFSGICIEKGTRKPIQDAIIAVTYSDTSTDTTLPLPFSYYIKKICADTMQYFENGSIITSSRNDGGFSFFALPIGAISVKIVAPGCEVFTTTEHIHHNKATTVRYYINKISYSEYDLVVYGKADQKEVSQRQLTVNEVRKVPGFGGDAIKAIQAFPGVSRTIVGSGEIIVRGAPTWDSRFFLNGSDIPLLYHFGELKSTYNSEALASIDFYPGGFGTRYGNAIAGVIEIQGRKGTRERIKGSAELSTLDGSLFIEGPVSDSITFIANVRRSFIGDVIHQLFKLAPESFPFTFYPYYWDYCFRSDISGGKWGNFYISLFGSQDSLSFIYPDIRFGSEEIDEQTDRMGMKTVFHTGSIGWEYPINATMKQSLKYNLMNIHYHFTSAGGKNKQDILVNHIRDQFSWNISNAVCLNIGADLQYSTATLNIVYPDAIGSIQQIKKNDWHFSDLAGYINVELQLLEKLQIIPGVRYDYYDELLYDGSILPAFWDYQSFDNNQGFSGEPSFRTNGRYTLTDKHTLKFALGTYNQTPKPMGEVILEGWGDPYMPATKAAQYVAGYEWQITDIVNCDVQTYFNKQWDIPAVNRDENISKNTSIFNHSGLGKMYGLECMLRHQQGKRFFGWAAYSLSRSERSDRSSNKWKVAGNDETHYLQLVGSWKLPKQWEAGFHLKFASGKPTTKVYGIKEEIENRIGSGSITAERGESNGDRMDPAFQIDLRIDKKIIKNNYIYSFFVDLHNIGWFLYKSPDWYMYNDFYDEKKSFSMFPLFAIGIRYEY